MEIKIKEKQVIAAAEKDMDAFISLFTENILEKINHQLSAKSMQELSESQNTLIAFHFFTKEMREGGFIQMIQNGYGGYLFDNPFAKGIRIFGAKDLSKLIYKAKKIFDLNREQLERETTEEEFYALYVEFEEFDDLEEKYFEIEEQETAAIASYIDNHIEEFATIIK